MDDALYNLVKFGYGLTYGDKKNTYKLKRQVGNLEQGSTWKVMEKISESEMARMYLSANILKTIFPDSKSYDLLFIRSSSSKLNLAARYDVELTSFDKECKAGNIPFNCLNGRCDIQSDGFVKINPLSSNRSVYYNSPIRSQQCVLNSSEINGGFAWDNPLPFDFNRAIIDFEKVFLMTLMLDTHAVFCDDYALKFKDDLISVRLQNLGDNFLSLTHSNPNYKDLLSVTVAKQFDPEVLKPLEELEANVYLRLVRILPNDFLNKFFYERLVAASEVILANKDKIAAAIYESIADIKYIFGESLLRELTFEKSQFSKYREKDVTFLSLKAYLRDMLDVNMKNLEKLKLCFKVETALINDDKEALTYIFYDELFKEDPLCISFYRHPHRKGYLDISQLAISKIAKTYKYQNDAADYYNSYWRGEVLLPEIEPDTWRDEL